MDLNNLTNAFGSKIASSMIPEQTANWGCNGICPANYAFYCESYNCNIHECVVYDCSLFTGCGFTCHNAPGGNDFTCYTYVLNPGCYGSTSIPCPGY